MRDHDRFASVMSGLMLGCLLAVPMTAAAQDEHPRTPDGQPDLQGVWNFSSATPMERPDELVGKETLTVEEAAEWEQELANTRAENESENENAPLQARVGYSVRVWFEDGVSLTDQRTALVIDPPDGQIPALTEIAARDRAEKAAAREGTGPHEPTPGGWVDDLGPTGLQVRCITGFNSGPPMAPSAYNNNVQLFQTPDHVVLLNEMNHNARIVPIDGRDHIDLKQWTGDSRGYWDGDTLVVETRNFLRETSFMQGGSGPDMHLTERFTRVSPETLMYEATVNDPATWTRPWTFQVSMNHIADPVYEYACHEGNYAMAVILASAIAGDDSDGSE